MDNKKTVLDGEEYVMLALMAALVPILCVEMFGVSAMRAAFPHHLVDDMPKPADLALSLATAAVIITLRFYLTEIFKPVGRRWLSPRHRELDDRVQRFATVFFKFLFYIAITTVGYLVMKDEPWFPAALGGSGEVVENYHWLSNPTPSTLKLYFLVQLGYHAHSLIYMVFLSPIRSDFMVNLVHHVATVLLISGSYLANATPFGAMVVFTHDIGDVTAYGVKCVMDSGNTPLTLGVYLSVITSWAYTRLYVFPFHLIYTSVMVLPQVDPEVPGIFIDPMNAMLCMLELLHIYWYYLILAMGFNFLNRGIVDDILEKCSLPAELPAVLTGSPASSPKRKHA